MKQQPGKDMQVVGGTTLVSSLMNLGLIDELQLMVNPLILGGGKALFKDVKERHALKLIRAKPLQSGKVALKGRPASEASAERFMTNARTGCWTSRTGGRKTCSRPGTHPGDNRGCRRVRPEHAVEMFRLLPHARLAVLPSDHGSYLGEVTAAQKDSKLPQLVVSMVEEFLDAPMPEGAPKMSSHTPKDWPRQFTQHLNAGDLDAVVALYEPDARFVERSGETMVGRDRIRDVLAGLIGANTRLHSRSSRRSPSARSPCYTPIFRVRRSMRRERLSNPSQGDRGPAPSARRHLEAHRGRPQRP